MTSPNPNKEESSQCSHGHPKKRPCDECKPECPMCGDTNQHTHGEKITCNSCGDLTHRILEFEMINPHEKSPILTQARRIIRNTEKQARASERALIFQKLEDFRKEKGFGVWGEDEKDELENRIKEELNKL